MNKTVVGFIGQGYVGKNCADDFERRGYRTVRYALEEPYRKNKENIRDCDVVFIAVPTPTTPEGFDASIVEKSVSLIGEGKAAIIKSTVLPGTTESIQKSYPDRTVLFSPEFLLERTAARDARHPIMNIVGMPKDSPEHRRQAKLVLSVLPVSPHNQMCSAREAEFIKYIHNCRAYAKIIMANLLYDLAQALGCRWEEVQTGMDADPMFSNWYNVPVHQGGRGAGGNCFVKDFRAFLEFYREEVGDRRGVDILEAIEAKNIELLTQSGKSLDVLEDVYGEKQE